MLPLDYYLPDNLKAFCKKDSLHLYLLRLVKGLLGLRLGL